MDVQDLPLALRARLGAEASVGLIQTLEIAREEGATAVMNLVADRFERRLAEELSKLRVEMAQEFAALRNEMTLGHAALRQEIVESRASLRKEMSDLKVDLLRWSFLFWIGQVAAVTAILGLMLRR